MDCAQERRVDGSVRAFVRASLSNLLFRGAFTNDMETTFIFDRFRGPAQAFLNQYNGSADDDGQN